MGLIYKFILETTETTMDEVEDPSNYSILDYGLCTVDNETVYNFFNLSKVHHVAIALQMTFISVVIAGGIVGNVAVIFLVLKDKRLRYRSVLASLSIVFVDLLLSIFYHGVILTNTLMRGWSYGEESYNSCRIYGILTTYLIYVRWIALSLIVTDRFLTVRFPFRYERHSRAFLATVSVLLWLVPAILAGFFPLPIVGVTFRANVPTCLPSCNNTDYQLLCKLLNAAALTIVVFFGGVVPPVLYCWMYHKGRKMRAMYTLGKLSLAVTSGIALRDNTPAQADKSSKEHQALLTLFLIFLSVFLTSLPSYFFLLLRQISICAFFRTPIYLHFVISDIFIISTALDPIILMRNQDFRIAVKKLLCKRTPLYISDTPSSPTVPNKSNGTSTTSL